MLQSKLRFDSSCRHLHTDFCIKCYKAQIVCPKGGRLLKPKHGAANTPPQSLMSEVVCNAHIINICNSFFMFLTWVLNVSVTVEGGLG